MSDTVIQVSNLSKKYQIKHNTGLNSYPTIREEFGNLFHSLLGKKDHATPAHEEFWALRDINFEIKAGEAVGIIGANGAGKSTLLKILSRIVYPTTGELRIRGRIGSLLEIGTGFHPELTGRENIFLNGGILGMSRGYLTRVLDEIVEFAEIEQFLDTAVKYYSSGMYMRLAFSVAAHLDPEILIIDEVLSVGDMNFQKKSLKKMESVTKEGKTLIFVSHDLTSLARLCPRTILLEKGQVVNDNRTGKSITQYTTGDIETRSQQTFEVHAEIAENEVVRLKSARVCNEHGETVNFIYIDEPVGIEMEFEVLEAGHVLTPNYHFFTTDGIYAFHSIEVQSEWYRKARPVGNYKTTAWIPPSFLADGGYSVGVAITTYLPVVRVHFFEQHAIQFGVRDTRDGTTARGEYQGEIPGPMRPLLQWSTEYNPI